MAANKWQVEHLRLTTFVHQPFDAGAQPQQLFRSYTDRDADSVTHNREAMSHVEQGKYGGGVLLITQAPGRIDAIHSVGAEAPAWLGSFAECAPQFFEDSSKFCAGLPANYEPFRVALGVVLALPVKSKAEGYSMVSRKLNLKLPDQASDLLFQINLPTTVEGIVLNRLRKFSVSHSQRATIEVSLLTGSHKVLEYNG